MRCVYVCRYKHTERCVAASTHLPPRILASCDCDVCCGDGDVEAPDGHAGDEPSEAMHPETSGSSCGEPWSATKEDKEDLESAVSARGLAALRAAEAPALGTTPKNCGVPGTSWPRGEEPQPALGITACHAAAATGPWGTLRTAEDCGMPGNS